MMRWVITALLVAVWVYLLRLLRKSELWFWRFLLGACGLFLLLFALVRPLLTVPLARLVAALAGVVGTATGTFSAFYKYGILFIHSAAGAITLQIDFECSGIIEIIAFLSLLAFFNVYRPGEKAIISVLGTIGIILANVVRLLVICGMIYVGGTNVYYIAHTIVGRLVFYVLSILLYFYVFTKPQILRTKIGKFSYEHH